MDSARYGRTLDDKGGLRKLTTQEDANRAKLHQAAMTIRDAILMQAQRQGRQPEMLPLPVLLKRAENYAFAEEIRAQERQAFSEKVTQQSKQRRPATGRTRVTPPKQASGNSDSAQSIANHPDLVKAWDQYQQENGTV